VEHSFLFALSLGSKYIYRIEEGICCQVPLKFASISYGITAWSQSLSGLAVAARRTRDRASCDSALCLLGCFRLCFLCLTMKEHLRLLYYCIPNYVLKPCHSITSFRKLLTNHNSQNGKQQICFC